MKWFCCSDIHSFYDELMSSLTAAGFDINDPEHGIIVCGDIFDRGNKPLEVYNFLRGLPKERRILIRGNHEYLLRDLVNRGWAQSHDIHNGTVDTLCYIAKIITDSEYNKKRLISLSSLDTYEADYKIWQKKLKIREHKKFHNRKLNEILKWIFSDECVNYYETNKYIFVHSFIPLHITDEPDSIAFYTGNFNYEYFDIWRAASEAEWEDATWGCPWKLYLRHFKPEIEKGKTLVCGHWRASDFWNNLDYALDYKSQLDTYGDNPMYKSDRCPNLIGLDTCTVVSHRVNVLVLDENEM